MGEMLQASQKARMSLHGWAGQEECWHVVALTTTRTNVATACIMGFMVLQQLLGRGVNPSPLPQEQQDLGGLHGLKLCPEEILGGAEEPLLRAMHREREVKASKPDARRASLQPWEQDSPSPVHEEAPLPIFLSAQ